MLCQGSVLQRRFALVQFGQSAEAYIANKGALPDMCAATVPEILDRIPPVLKSAAVCGSSEKGSVYYSCQIPPEQSGDLANRSPVIETCRYSLVDQSVSCENRTVVTTFGEADSLESDPVGVTGSVESDSVGKPVLFEDPTLKQEQAKPAR